MVETTLEIRFSGDGEAEVTIDSNVSGETAAQAELIAFAHHTARVISLLGPARAGTLVHALTRLEPGAPLEPAAAGGVGTLHALARFINGASGPRMYFRLKSSGSPDAASSVNLVLDSLRRRRAHEDGDEPLTRTAALLARLGATGQVRRENEFDVALATADVAWRHTSRDWMAGVGVVAHCPACGNEDGDTGFELRLWPSDTAAIRRCRRCGAGLWVRESHAPRLLREDVWSAMESMRHELSAIDRPEVSSVEATRPLLEELKRVFAEHGWPYTEVRGAPVLVTELSGPGGRWSFYAQIVEEKDVILLYSICPERVPEGRRAEVSKFLTRANYGLAAGNFELDFDDGEVRYKTVLQLQGDELDGLTLKRLMRANGVAMETYLPGIRSVVAGAPGDSTT